MSITAMEPEIFSTYELARRHRVSPHCVRQVIDRLGLGRRLGTTRVIEADELDTVEMGLRAAGYLKHDPDSGEGGG